MFLPPHWAASSQTIYKAERGSGLCWCSLNRSHLSPRADSGRCQNFSVAFTFTASRPRVWGFWLSWRAPGKQLLHRLDVKEQGGLGSHPGCWLGGWWGSQQGPLCYDLQECPRAVLGPEVKTLGRWCPYSSVSLRLHPALTQIPRPQKWTGSNGTRGWRTTELHFWGEQPIMSFYICWSEYLGSDEKSNTNLSNKRPVYFTLSFCCFGYIKMFNTELSLLKVNWRYIMWLQNGLCLPYFKWAQSWHLLFSVPNHVSLNDCPYGEMWKKWQKNKICPCSDFILEYSWRCLRFILFLYSWTE